MKFCGTHPISCGVTPLESKRFDILMGVLNTQSLAEISGFVVAFRKTSLGFEWRLYPVSFPSQLLCKQARCEHIISRKMEGFRFYVIEIRSGSFEKLWPQPKDLCVPYLEFTRKLHAEA